MYYFTVRARSLVGQELLEVDIALAEVSRLADRLENLLITCGCFSPTDRILKRLEPGGEPGLDGIAARIVTEVPADIGSKVWDVYLREDPWAADQPVTRMSFWFCASITGRIVVIDLPAFTFFWSALQYLRDTLVVRRSVAADEKLDYSIYLREISEPTETWMPGTPTILTIPEPSDAQGSDPVLRVTEGAAVSVTVTDRQILFTPAQRAWADYQPQLQGHAAGDDLRVLLSRTANDRLERLSRDGLSWNTEGMGFLIGQVYRDPALGLFTDIEDVVAVRNPGGVMLNLQLDAPVLNAIFNELRQRYPGCQRIGWYHTHAIGSRRLEPLFDEGVSTQSRTAVQRMHISVADSQFHRSYFPAPWQVILVLDLKERTKVFYQWRDDQLARCQGYYLYERAPGRVSLAGVGK